MGLLNKNKKDQEPSPEVNVNQEQVADMVFHEEEPSVEQSTVEKVETKVDEKKELESTKEKISSTKTTSAKKDDKAPSVKSQDQVEIEKIMSEGLGDIYSELPSNRKAEFKEKGEVAANKIEKILNSTKVQFGKIVGLIKKWLSMLPGVNKFFLEQESKIKADRIVDYKDHN
ncbi:hypothetical protein HN958_00855 [Candidatus Falkowbacteria bacterium]|jgi:hypothetical protein|nr:hypothetical protein [Candidatus Falkowbacteria bacterium]MBT7007040.1 hypothetical protein [Candidatus Falkowbacteria bacterium]